jgi:hypothetical protein
MQKGKKLRSFSSICGPGNTSRDFAFRVVCKADKVINYCHSNTENKISVFLNFISTELKIEKTGETYDFHVPRNNFCSLSKG